ncbi:MAG: hypothetical protein WC757_01615 [Candidatus Paceibacterota bacterium]|jgi:type IV secretory pathway VirB4 component
MSSTAQATQKFVSIQEVRDGIAIMKDGSMRGIIMASSVNFSLKSQEEKQSILMQFQNFLNSLDFTVQIIVQSRRLDVGPYAALLEKRYKEQTIDLLKIQIQEYIDFVKKFTDEHNIMVKSFFLVVPYAQAMTKQAGSTFSMFSGKKSASVEKASFEETVAQLEQRVAVVMGGLSACGIRSVQLGTKEVTELFYGLFNPGDTEKQIKMQ